MSSPHCVHLYAVHTFHITILLFRENRNEDVPGGEKNIPEPFESAYHSTSTAHQQYRDTLINSRNSFELTSGQLIQINDIVSPLVRHGQSVYPIVKTNQHSLPVSEPSIRRLIHCSELDIRLIDLPAAVRRKPATPSLPPVSKNGHLYQDYPTFIQSQDLPIVQMDCVEGCNTDSAAILTLHFICNCISH